MMPWSRPARAENIAVQSPGFRAVFDRGSGGLREIKCHQWLVAFSPPGGRLLAEDFPGAGPQVLTATSCRVSDQRVQVGYSGPELTCELEWRIERGMLRADGRLENGAGRDRAVVLTYELPWTEDGLRFSPSLNGAMLLADQPKSGWSIRWPRCAARMRLSLWPSHPPPQTCSSWLAPAVAWLCAFTWA